MSADNSNENADGTEGSAGNEGNIKALREAADRGRAAVQEADELRKQLAFAKAGIDTDSKLGAMLFKTYDGDLSNVDALKAEWAELNPAATQAGAPETAPTPPGFQDPAGQQQHREATAPGQAVGETPPNTVHPVDLALERFHNGTGTVDDRQEGAMATMLEAYFTGDKRVMFDGEAYRQQAMQASAGDLAQ